MSGAVLIGVQAGRVMPANSGQSLARCLLQHCQADLRRRLAIALAGHADLLTMRPAGGKSKRTSQSQTVSNNICRRIGKQGYPRDRPLLPKSGLPPVHRTDLEGRLWVDVTRWPGRRLMSAICANAPTLKRSEPTLSGRCRFAL
jgi:hypothetical protein